MAVDDVPPVVLHSLEHQRNIWKDKSATCELACGYNDTYSCVSHVTMHIHLELPNNCFTEEEMSDVFLYRYPLPSQKLFLVSLILIWKGLLDQSREPGMNL
jgi:hypothetical protein